MPKSGSIDTKEIIRFSDCDQDWWNPDGAWKPLHMLNPARIKYIESIVLNHFGLKNGGKTPFKNLSVLDIGCGGGLVCEPLARLGAKVTGLDASETILEVARKHADNEKLKISYVNGCIEDFEKSSSRRSLGEGGFDVVLAMEILEHAADIGSLLQSAASLLKPDGILILSTVNRTTKSYLLGIVAAEYILGWVPKGMHDWDRFIKPSELAAHLQKAGLTLSDISGAVFNPLSSGFELCSGKVDVNYLAAAVKNPA